MTALTVTVCSYARARACVVCVVICVNSVIYKRLDQAARDLAHDTMHDTGLTPDREQLKIPGYS
jgi:hypothetical protein